MDWKTLKQFHLNPPTYAFNRSEDVKREYREFIDKVGKPISEVIRERFFPHADPLSSTRWIYALNKFPYEMDPDIVHTVAWIQPGEKISEEDIIKDLHVRNIEDMVVFRNPTNLMSVPALDHIQVFILAKDKSKINIQTQ
jgi:hypothetical protein